MGASDQQKWLDGNAIRASILAEVARIRDLGILLAQQAGASQPNLQGAVDSIAAMKEEASRITAKFVALDRLWPWVGSGWTDPNLSEEQWRQYRDVNGLRRAFEGLQRTILAVEADLRDGKIETVAIGGRYIAQDVVSDFGIPGTPPIAAPVPTQPREPGLQFEATPPDYAPRGTPGAISEPPIVGAVTTPLSTPRLRGYGLLFDQDVGFGDVAFTQVEGLWGELTPGFVFTIGSFAWTPYPQDPRPYYHLIEWGAQQHWELGRGAQLTLVGGLGLTEGEFANRVQDFEHRLVGSDLVVWDPILKAYFARIGGYYTRVIPLPDGASFTAWGGIGVTSLYGPVVELGGRLDLPIIPELPFLTGYVQGQVDFRPFGGPIGPLQPVRPTLSGGIRLYDIFDLGIEVESGTLEGEPPHYSWYFGISTRK
jgi:hypothetical protein